MRLIIILLASLAYAIHSPINAYGQVETATIQLLDIETGESVGPGEAYLSIEDINRRFEPQSKSKPIAILPISEDGELNLAETKEGNLLAIRVPAYLPKNIYLNGEPQKTIYLQPALEYSGIVLDPNGLPCSHAKICLHSNLYDVQRHDQRHNMRGAKSTYYSDEDGRFTISLLPCKFLLEVHADGWAPSISQLYDSDTLGQEDLQLKLRKGHWLKGNVINAEARGVEEAEIKFTWSIPKDHADDLLMSYSYESKSTSNPNGSFKVLAPEGANVKSVSVSHPSYLLFSAYQPTEFEFELKNGYQLSGQLTVPNNEEMPTELKLFQIHKKYGWLEFVTSFKIEPNGSFNSEPFLPHRNAKSANQAILIANSFNSVSIEWPTEFGEQELGTIAISKAKPFEVYLSNSEGEALGGAKVQLKAKSNYSPRYTIYTATTDLNGHATVYADSELKRPHLYASLKGYRNYKRLVADYQAERHITLVKHLHKNIGQLKGLVVDAAGRPIRFAKISLSASNSRFSALDGSFSFDNLPTVRPSKLRITVNGFCNLEADIEFDESEEIDLGKISMDKMGTVAGMVLDENMDPVANATVKLSTTVKLDERSSRIVDSFARTDRNGKFSREATPGIYVASASASGLLPTPGQEIEVHSGGKKRVELILKGKQGHSRNLEFEIVNPEGDLVAGAEITLVAKSNGAHESYQTTSDGNGWLIFKNVPKGSISISGRKTGFLPTSYSYKDLDSVPNQIVLETGAILELELQVPEGYKLPETISFLEPQYGMLPSSGKFRPGFPVKDGKVVVSGCREENFTFRVRAKKFANSKEFRLSLKNRQRTKIIVPLLPGPGETKFRVHDPDGNPIDNVNISISNGSDVFYGGVATDSSGIAIFPNSLSYHLQANVNAPSGFEGKLLRNFLSFEKDGFIDIVLNRGGDLRLSLQDVNGDAIKKAAIAEYGIAINGVFETTGLAVGQHTLDIHRPAKANSNRYSFSLNEGPPVGKYLGSIQVKIEAGKLTKANFTLAKLGKVNGIVVHNGKALSSGRIDSRFGSCMLAEDGTFVMPVRGAGKLKLTYRAKGFAPLNKIVEIPADESSILQFEIGSFKLTGTTVKENGKISAGVKLGLYASNSGSKTLSECISDENGNFQFESLVEGEYYIRLMDNSLLAKRELLKLDKDMSLNLEVYPTQLVELKKLPVDYYLGAFFITTKGVVLAINAVRQNDSELPKLWALPIAKGSLLFKDEFSYDDASSQIAWVNTNNKDYPNKLKWAKSGLVSLYQVNVKTSVEFRPLFKTTWKSYMSRRVFDHDLKLSLPRGRYRINLSRGNAIRQLECELGGAKRSFNVDEIFAKEN